MRKKNLNILAIIPARGGSKGIPRKNIKLLVGKPLLAYTVEAALVSTYLARIVLSTEDKEIADVGKKFGADVPFLRPVELAQDDTPALPVFQHVIRELGIRENYQPDIIVILQPTSPLRDAQHIDEAIEIFLQSQADSLVSVVEVPHNMNPYSVMKLETDGSITSFLPYDETKNIRQIKPKFYARNGAAIYICTYDCLMRRNSLYGNKTIPYFMKKEESFDIDDQVDWEIIETFISSKRTGIDLD